MNAIKKILVVDDDMDDVQLFGEVIANIEPSIKLQHAEDGRDALEKLAETRNHLPDLIFLDLNMPRMDGKECLKKIKKDDQLNHIPVIIYTTSSQINDIEETMEAGAVCFITKPNNLKELERILVAVIGCIPADLEGSLRNLSKDTGTLIHC